MQSVAEIRPHLACPLCRCGLASDGEWLVCAEHSEHRYESLGGVPILLGPEERETLGVDLEQAAQMRTEYAPSFFARTKRTVKSVLGANRHLPLSPTVTDVWARNADGFSLDIGSGVTNASGRHVNLDIAPFANVDVVGSGLALPFSEGTFRLARNLAVLEHVRDPQRMVAEIHRVLEPGGYCYAEVPFIQHFHAYPNDFQRYTTEGFKELFRAFEHVETGVCVGPGSALTALAADYCELFTFSRKRFVNDLVRLIPALALFPLKFLDGFLVRHNPRAHEIASGIYMLARKPV